MNNPYQPSVPSEHGGEFASSPLSDALNVTEAAPTETTESVKPGLFRTFGKWFVICWVSAAPSFVLGAVVNESQYARMATGVSLFILGYVWLDRYTWNYPWRQKPVIRRILRVMYTTRIVISVSMIGTPLDMACGILALGATAFLFQNLGMGGPTSFAAALIATCVQGTILNCVLVLYGLVLFAGYSAYKNLSR